MKRVLLLVVFIFCFASFISLVSAQDEKKSSRYIGLVPLSDGFTAVISEGDYEPRSIGSYSVRIYKSSPKAAVDLFVCGTILKRNGYIEKVELQDVNADGIKDLVVVIRCVGSGSYLSADAFEYKSNRLSLIARVANLKADANPIKALKRKGIDKDAAVR